MTFVNLAPNATLGSTGALTGSSVHAALSDSSDATFVEYTFGEYSSVSFADLTLPSGGVVVLAQLVLRTSRDGTGPGALSTTLTAGSPSNQVGSITWSSPKDLYSASRFGGVEDADVDDAWAIWTCTSLSEVTVYEAWVRVLYLTQPTLTVTSPSGTITTNRASIGWTPSFDEHAQSSPYYFQAKIFSSAQYSAGGFNPETSTATTDSGVVYSAATTTSPENRLPNGNYRAYVKVAAGNSPSQWSAWTYGAFTVDAPDPGVPSLSCTGENSQGRIKIDLDDTVGDATTHYFHVQKNDGTGFRNVRTSAGNGMVQTNGSAVTIYDYETPNGVTCTYRARAYNLNNASYSDWASTTAAWSSDRAWFKNVLDPSKNVSLGVKSYLGFDSPANQGVFRALGSSVATVVQDTPGSESGQVELFTDSDSERASLTTLLVNASPVLMQVKGHPDRMVMLGDRSSERVVDMASVLKHVETVGWTTVAWPAGALYS